MEDDELSDVLGQDLLNCISQSLKKPKRSSQGQYSVEKLLSQQKEDDKNIIKRDETLRGSILSQELAKDRNANDNSVLKNGKENIRDNEQDNMKAVSRNKQDHSVALRSIGENDHENDNCETHDRNATEFQQNRTLLRSVADIANEIEDERAREFFTTSDNLETLLGPEEDEESGMPETHLKVLGDPNYAELKQLEKSGLLRLHSVSLQLNKKNATKRQKLVAEDNAKEVVASVHAKIAGGWLIQFLGSRDINEYNEILKGLYEVTVATRNRLLSHNAASALCKAINTPEKNDISQKRWIPNYENVKQSLIHLGYVDGDERHCHTAEASKKEGTHTNVLFNLKSILRVMASLGSRLDAKDSKNMIRLTMCLFREETMVPMDSELHSTLAKLLLSLNRETWDAIKDELIISVCEVKPNPLAAVESLRTLKRALLSDLSIGMERWQSIRFGIAKRLLCTRLGLKDKKIVDIDDVIDVLETIRESDMLTNLSNQYKENLEDKKWDILACLCTGDSILEDATASEIDDVCMMKWLNLLHHISKFIRTTRTVFEQKMKSTLTELLSRYGFIRKENRQANGLASLSVGGTPSKSCSCNFLDAENDDDDCAVE